MKWRRFSGQKIDDKITDYVEKTLIQEQKNGNKIKVCIGSDSQVKGDVVEMGTVIVFLREKKGGFMYIANQQMKNNMSLKERMIKEVSLSVQIAYSLCHILDKYNVALEVHADINTDPNFKSNSALKEAMGYILGMGFVFKAKPNAFASSSCADKIVH